MFPPASARPRAISSSARPSRRRGGHQPHARGCSISAASARSAAAPAAVTRPDGRVGRLQEQPERVVAEVPGLGRARGAAQRGGRVAGVRRELRGLLVPPL